MNEIIYVLIILAVVGLCLYLVGLIPMDATILRVIRVVVIFIVVVWLLLKVILPMLGMPAPSAPR